MTILSLYDSNETAFLMAQKMAPKCTSIGCNYKNRKLSAIALLRRIVTSGTYDIIHTHHTLSGTLSRLFGYNRNQTKIIHTLHSNYHSYSTLQNFLIGITLNRCHCIVANSRSTYDGLYNWQKKMALKCHKEVIYNGIDTKRIINATDNYANEFFTSNSISKEDFIFIQVGRLESVKNPILSLKAFELLIKDGRNKTAKFIFVGDGSERKELENHVNQSVYLLGRVFFTGMILRDQVYSIMKNSKAMIVPSLYEGFCNALFEGMTAGLQLMISNIPVFSELINENSDIYKFNCYDVEDAMKGMTYCIQNEWTIEKRIEWSRRAILEYDISFCIERYISLYEKLIKGIE